MQQELDRQTKEAATYYRTGVQINPALILRQPKQTGQTDTGLDTQRRNSCNSSTVPWWDVTHIWPDDDPLDCPPDPAGLIQLKTLVGIVPHA